MSILQAFDRSRLDTLLRQFADRPQPLDLDRQLLTLMQALHAAGLDRLPLPGQGQTLQRWQTLARVAGADLSLAKLYEGHTDALAILAECAGAHLAGDGIWGVWAAEPPSARVRIVAREAQVDSALAAQVVKLGQALRRLEQHDLEEVASTRLRAALEGLLERLSHGG